MKKLLIILILAIVSIPLLLCPWVGIFLGMVCEPNPPTPEIKYGEFPFRIEYSIDGEQFVVEDTLICEYDGIKMNEGIGKYREWKTRLASGKKTIILLQVKGVKEEGYASEEIDSAVTTLYFDCGSGGYYMGELHARIPNFPDASYSIKDKGNVTEEGRLSEQELYEKYGIKIISLEIAPPIKNTFKRFWQ